MNQNKPAHAALFLLVALVTMCMTSMVTCTRQVLHAQDSVAVELARLCVSECGWDCPDECAAIHQSLHNRAQLAGISFRAQLRAHRSVTRVGHQPLRPWLAELNARGRAPRSWDATVTIPWSRRRASWLETLQAARDILEAPRNPCDGNPLDWGVHSAVARYRRAYIRAVTLDCGPTVNVFLRPEPELSPEDGPEDDA